MGDKNLLKKIDIVKSNKIPIILFANSLILFFLEEALPSLRGDPLY